VGNHKIRTYMKSILLLISVATLLTTAGCIFPGHGGGGEYHGHGEYREHEEYQVVPAPVVVVRVPAPAVVVRVHAD
jgi:hypothetical protein